MNLYYVNWLLLMILSAIWGGAFTLNKSALVFYSPEFIVFARLVIGSFILFILLMIIYRKITIYIKDWPYYLFMSTVGIVAPFILIVYGQKNIDSSLAGILMATMPISTIILSHFFLHDEKLTKSKFIGFIIAFVGICILVIKDYSLVNINIISNISSELMVISGAILYSCSAVYGKKFKHTDPLSASSGTIFFSSIIMFLYLLLFNPQEIHNVDIKNSFSLIMLGIFCTAIATIIYFQILQTSGASFISIMNYLIPMWSILFGVIFFNERLFINYFIGLSFVIIGINISQKGIALGNNNL